MLLLLAWTASLDETDRPVKATAEDSDPDSGDTDTGARPTDNDGDGYVALAAGGDDCDDEGCDGRWRPVAEREDDCRRAQAASAGGVFVAPSSRGPSWPPVPAVFGGRQGPRCSSSNPKNVGLASRRTTEGHRSTLRSGVRHRARRCAHRRSRSLAVGDVHRRLQHVGPRRRRLSRRAPLDVRARVARGLRGAGLTRSNARDPRRNGAGVRGGWAGRSRLPGYP